MHRHCAAVLALCVLALGSQRASAQLCSQHTFLGDSPSEGRPGWHDGTQGLAHDRDNWYVTDTNVSKTRSILWRIPVTTDLAANVSCGNGGVSCSYLSDLRLHAYDHYGDPDVYEFNGRGYVLVPLEGRDSAAPDGVIIFRAVEDADLVPGVPSADENLEFLTFTHFTGQVDAPWVAVDGDGILYSSRFDTQTVINRFYLDWASFQANEAVRPTLVPLDPLLLQDETGAPLSLRNVQGGEFSDDGRRLYISSGNGRGEALPIEGLHVFTIQTVTGDQCGPGPGHCLVARRIEHSHNSDASGFSFEFHPGFHLFQEPEGLTFWDLDVDRRAPGLGGQLHVVLLDNNVGAEQVYVKHYTFTDIDSDPPTIGCPAPIIAECVSPAGVLSSDSQLGPFFAGVSATDVCTSPLIDHNAPAAFPVGSTPVTFTATDDSGNASACQSTVTVVDTTAPTISVRLSRDILWPADHSLIPVTAHLTVADACGSPAFELVSLSSNEPDDGIADGHTSDDIQGAAFGTADTSFLLRAERAATGQGREYKVVYRVTDGSGNASVATATVRVPLSQ